jgi:hypothetical protein
VRKCVALHCILTTLLTHSNTCFLASCFLTICSRALLPHSFTRSLVMLHKLVAPQLRRAALTGAPLTHSHIHILTYSTFTYLTYSHTHTFTNLLTHALTHSLSHSLLCSSRSAPLRAHSLTRSATALLPLLPQDRVLGTHSLTHSLTALLASPYSE